MSAYTDAQVVAGSDPRHMIVTVTLTDSTLVHEGTRIWLSVDVPADAADPETGEAVSHGAFVRLVPDEAREIARLLLEYADTATRDPRLDA
jgi:hypothetical protein